MTASHPELAAQNQNAQSGTLSCQFAGGNRIRDELAAQNHQSGTLSCQFAGTVTRWD